MFLILLILSIVSLSVGSVHIELVRVFNALVKALTGNLSISSEEELILFSVRLPRILFAGIVGAALSLGGVIFQALLRNPLADPYILGISGGSALGAIIGIVIGAGSFYPGVPLLAFIGALVTVFLVFVVAGASRGALQDNSLLLSGVVVNAFFSAAILFFLSIVNSMELHSITFWLMGDLSRASGRELYLAASCLIIGFVGIMVPHFMRLVFGSDHRLLLPVSALFGASFLMVADTVARVVLAPAELPVGVITALCGAPYFIFLLRRKAY